MPSPLLSAPETPRIYRPRRRRPPLLRRALTISLRLTVIAMIAAIAGSGWYLAKKGFGRKWRQTIVQELHDRGVEASVRRLTLDPFRGLVAKDVRIYDYKKRESTLALISEISLDINYAALLHHQAFLNAIDIRNGELTMPLPGATGNSTHAQLERFHAHIYFPPEQIYVSQAEGIFCGVRVSATGQLIKRNNYQASAETSPQEAQRRMEMLLRFVNTLEQFHFPGATPHLQVHFLGDLSQLEDARVEATLRGERVARDNYEVQNVFAALEWKDQQLSLSQLSWNDGAGSFSGRGSWSRQTGEAKFQARSSLQLKSLLDAFGLGGALSEMKFSAAPQIETSGSAKVNTSEHQLDLIGRVSLDNFVYKTVPFESLTADFAWNGDRMMLRDIRLRHSTGQLAGDLLDQPNDFRLNFRSSVKPGALMPLAPPGLREFLAEWEWQQSPTVRLAIRGTSRDPASWHGEGVLGLERTRFRGVWMNSARADLRFGDGSISFDNFRVTRDEGVGTGSFRYEFDKHELLIANVKTTLRPADAIFWIDPKFWTNVVPYKFNQIPNVTANGVVQFGGGKNTHLEIDVDAPTGLNYVFLDKTLPFARAAGRLLFTNDRLQISDLEAGLFSGNVRGLADISLAHDDPHYRAEIQVEKVDFPSLTDLYFKYKTSQGSLSGNYDFTGSGGDPRSMRGDGKVKVTNGNVFAIPIFGPISDLLNKIVPGAGYSLAHQATASFTIKDGVVHTDNLDVDGRLFRLLGYGDINFLDNKLDFDLRINAKGAPAFVLFPMSKLFQYKGEGSFTKPIWRPKRLPRELFRQ